jgi:hypothetical protein
VVVRFPAAAVPSTEPLPEEPAPAPVAA